MRVRRGVVESDISVTAGHVQAPLKTHQMSGSAPDRSGFNHYASTRFWLLSRILQRTKEIQELADEFDF